MLAQLRQVLLNECKLTPDRPVLAGVSGGADSLCLFHILWKLGYPVVVAHLDHTLRAESAADAQRVQALAASYGLPFYLARENVRAYADTHMHSLEEAARIVRYRFLFEQAERSQAQAVVVAHTADDQVETVLMHLLRGSGLSGLKGMDYYSLPNAWSREIPLARPLLGVWREEVQSYNRDNNLQPSDDSTNRDTRYYRNRLRHELIPYLQDYNPQARQLIWRMAEVLGQDETALEGMAEAAWTICLTSQGEGYLALDALALRDQPLAIQRRLIRRAVQALRPGLRDFDYAAVERAVTLISTSSRGGRCDLVGGIHLFLENESAWMATWEAQPPAASGTGQVWPQITPGSEIILPNPGKISLPGDWLLMIETITADIEECESTLVNADPYQAWLDADSLAWGEPVLHLRTRREGDSFQPLGLGGHRVKLSDFFINTKLPRRARDGWPLVISGEAIAWIPGLRLAHPFRLQDDTRRIIHIRLSRD